MRRFPLIGLLLLVFGPGDAGAAPAAVRLEDPTPYSRSWRFFDARDCPIAERTRAICQARDGAVWFAGRAGVCRYDGVTWTVYDPKTTGAPIKTFAILQARDGAIWVGSEGGVSRFDPSASSGQGGRTWRTYTEADGLPGPVVLSIREGRDGAIWVGCGKRPWLPRTLLGGLARWDGLAWKAFRPEDGLAQEHVNDICQDRDGAIWAATDGGVSRYDGRRWVSYKRVNGLPDEEVWSVYQATDGAMWFGTGSGVARFADDVWAAYTLGEKKRTVESLHQTRDGTLWAYAQDNNLYRFDPSDSLRAGGAQWRAVEIPLPGPGHGTSRLYGTEEDVLWLTGVRTVRFDYGGTKWASYRDISAWDTSIEGAPYQDPEGRLWFRHMSGGAAVFDGKDWKTFLEVEGPVHRTPQGVLWCGGRGGIRSFDGRVWRTYSGVLDTLRTITQGRDGRLWFTGKRGDRSAVACYDGVDWKTYVEEAWGERIPLALKAVEASNGDLWFLPARDIREVGYGIVRFDGKRWYHYTARDVRGESVGSEMANRAYDLATDGDGRVWVGTGDGLWCFDGASWKTFEEAAGRKVVRVRVAKDGGLWCACAQKLNAVSGLLRYKEGVWTTYTTADGLAGNDVWGLFEAGDGALWVGTTTGASRFDGRAWVTYRKEDGLISENVLSVFQDVRGDVWFGWKPFGEDRTWITRYRPDRLPPETTLTFLPGEELSSGNLVLEWSGKDAWKDTPVEALAYSWQMDDGKWSPFSPENKHVFLDLPSGAHTFRVQAMDRDGNVDLTPAIYAFTVLPPVWKQPWFIGLMAVLVGAIGFQTGRVIYRDRLLQASNAALSEANQELFGLNQELRQKTGALVEANQKLDESNAALASVNQDLFGLNQELRQKTEALDESNRALQEKTKALEQANERLQEADQLKTDFFSNVSHELRTPMTAIKGYVDNLLDGIAGKLGDRQERYLTRVQVNVDRLTRLINDLLYLLRPDPLRLNIVRLPVREVVRETVEGLRPVSEGAGLGLRLEGEESYALADRDRLAQIVTNLVGNAIKFTPSGGMVEVSVGSMGSMGRDDTSHTSHTGGEGDGGFVVVCIRDTGKGIPPEDLRRIFDRFYQVRGEGGRQAGAGLGLAISKELVELQGGRIWAESEVGKGSAFWFTLPESKP